MPVTSTSAIEIAPPATRMPVAVVLPPMMRNPINAAPAASSACTAAALAVGGRMMAPRGTMLDTLRQSDLVCRYGGEEFAFVFPESTLLETEKLAERFRALCAETDIRLADGRLVRVTMSMGLADASDCPIEVALKRADEALYEAKHQGRNRVVVSKARAGR